MRAIKIDPSKQTVEAVETAAELADMYKLIETDIIEAVRVGPNTILWVDEEGLLRERPKPFFAFRGFENQPHCGVGVILNCNDEGENESCNLKVTDVWDKIVWLPDLEFVGIETVEEGPVEWHGMPGFTHIMRKPIFRKKGSGQ